MNGGEALVRTLLCHGVRTAFCVPGESFLAVLDALARRAGEMRLITNRHESGAAFAANGYAKIARRPGIAFVSRGPGAANAAIGVHTAAQDSIPLVLFVGQVPRAERGREAFQEIDCRAVFGSMVKAVLEPPGPADTPRIAAEALALACAGRPGPVVVALPEDVTEAEAGEAAAIPPPVPPPVCEAAPARLAEAVAAIDGARRVLIVAGELVKAEAATMRLGAFAEAAGAAVVAAFRCQDVLNNDHPAYAGVFGRQRPPYLRRAWAEADLAILAGSRLDAVTGEDFALAAEGGRKVLAIHPSPEVIARLAPDLGIAAAVGPTLRTLAGAVATPEAERAAWQVALKAGFERYRTEEHETVGRVSMAGIVRHADRRLAAIDHVVANDAGNFAGWLHRHFRYRLPDSQAGPMAGAMGYALPAAIGAALARPGARVVAFAGDGGFQMSMQELATAVQHRLKIAVVVCDNGQYGTIAAAAAARAGGRLADGQSEAFRIPGPDFAALARACGAPAWRVESTEAFAPAFDEALARDGPGLIHVVTDPRDAAADAPAGN